MKQKRLMTVVLLVLIVLASVMAFVGCKKYKIPDEAYTEYYYEDGGMTKGFILTQEGFTLKEISGDKTGTYTFNKKNGEFTFTLEGKEMTGTYADGTLTLKADGNTYVCKKGKIYKVTYKAEGTTGVPSKYIAENAVLTEPPQPTKAGQIFTGWYADGGFKVPYKFGVAVKGDVTIYAKFVDPALATYTVSFEGSKNPIKPQTTNKAGIIENLPTAVQDGKEFLGWWMSDYEDATKLTCQYTDQAIGQNLTLFAVFKDSTPAVSIDSETVRWENKGLSASYKVTIYDSDNNKLLDNTFTGVYETRHNLADKPAGEYRVEVVLNNGSKGTAYYRNKALDRVSIFKINTENDFMLEFEPVRNAETYIVTVECGNETHEHIAQYTDQEIGYRTYFDFSDCEMRESGINFTVKAAARGYLTSASAKFNLNRRLDAVSKLSVNDNEEITFENVAHAKAYAVSINGGDYVALSSIGSLKEYAAGEIKIKIRATAKGYNPSESEEFVYTKTKIATPKNSTFEVKGDALTWEKIEGATKYIVKIGDKEYETSTNSLPFSQVTLTGEAVEVSIKAVSSNTANDSLYSDVVTFSPSLKDKVTYSNNTVRWAIVFGATEYEVILNGKSMGKINGISKEITLTQKENEIEVVYYNKATAMGSEKITVKAYEIVMYTNFEPNAIYTKAYAAVGDKIAFATGVTRLGYTFRHWSDTTGGTEYSNTTLETAQDLKLYAQWTANKYNVTLSFEGGVMDGESTVEVTFDSNFVFPVPKDKNNVMAFAGWTLDQSGTQFLTDYTGKGSGNWTTPKDTVLYAKWVDVFKFYKLANGNYSIIGYHEGITYLSEVTIPSMYDGKLVEIIEGQAFSNVTTMKVVNIPDTVQYVETGIYGINNSGSAFYYCTNLTYINVYYVIGNHERMYASCDGVLFYKKGHTPDETTIFAELKGYPVARTATTYTVPSTFEVQIGEAESAVQKVTWKVTVIGRRVIHNTSLVSLTIPATVEKVEAHGISYNYYIEKLEFLDGKAGEAADGLVLEDRSIHYLTVLKEIVLPTRLKDFAINQITFCNELTKVTFAGEGGDFVAKDNMVCGDKGSTLIWAPLGFKGELTIPSGVTKIGEKAFFNSYITGVTIPEWVDEIQSDAFNNSVNISKLIFIDNADTKLTIAKNAFYGCQRLRELELPSRVQTIEESAFGFTSGLYKVTVKSTGKTAEGETVPTLAFADNAFGSTHGFYVTELTIGKGVPAFSIAGVFGDRLNKITIEDESAYFEVKDGVIFDKGVNTLIYIPKGVTGNYVVPDTVTKISSSAALNHAGLTGLVIGNGVTEIGEKAFFGCTQLATVTFKETSKVETIGSEAFAQCTALAAITLPASLKTFGEKDGAVLVFDGCSALRSIDVEAGSARFKAVDGILYGLNETGDLTELCFIPKTYAENGGVLTVPATVTRIWVGAFSGTTGIKKVVFEDNENIVLGSRIFFNCYALEEVVLPKGLKEIPSYAFSKSPRLLTLTIPNTVTNIDSYAFDQLVGLTSLEFERADATNKEDLTMGIYGLHELSSLTTLTFSDRLKVIPQFSVAFCNALKTVNIPASVTEIEGYAFYSTTRGPNYEEFYVGNLTTVNIEDTDKPIYKDDKGQWIAGRAGNLQTLAMSFYNNQKLKYINLPDSLSTFGYATFAYTAIEHLTVPAGISAIYWGDLAEMKQLRTIDFKGYATSYLESYWLDGCTSLEKVTLPPNLTEVPSALFAECASLKTVLFDVYPADYPVEAKRGKSDLETIESGAFDKCLSLETLGLKQYAMGENPKNVLPDGLKTLSDKALYGLVSLKSIVLPATIGKIGKSAFAYSGIEKVEFKTYPSDYAEETKRGKSDLTSIGDFAFESTKLTSFVFPESTADNIIIGQLVFKRCDMLASIAYSNSVKYGLGHVLNGTHNVTTVTYPEGYDEFNDISGITYNKDGNTVVYVGTKIAQKTFVVPAHVTAIGDYAFKGQTEITKILIPSTLQSIGNGAFFGNSSLTEIFFYKTKIDGSGNTVADLDGDNEYQKAAIIDLRVISQGAFAYCSSLTDFVIPNAITAIEDGAFYGCMNLGKNATAEKPFILPNTVKKYGNKAFYGTGLTYVKLTGDFSDVKFGTHLFAETAYLNNVDLNVEETKITEIPAHTFYRSAISKIDLKGISKIGASAFARCGLTTVTIPSTVKEMGAKIFENAKKLTKVTFENNDVLTAFGNETFVDCTSLVEVDMTRLNALIYVGTYTFRNTALKSIELPESVVHLGNNKGKTAPIYSAVYLFRDCTELESVVLSSKLESMGAGIFQDAYKLRSVTYRGYDGDKDKAIMPSTLVSLGNFVFFGTGIRQVDLSLMPADAKLGSSLFTDCKQLVSAEFNSGIKAFNTNMFTGCISLKEFDLSKYPSTTKVSSYMFLSSGLESVTFHDGIKQVEPAAFKNTPLRSVVLPSSVTTLSNNSFENTALTFVDLTHVTKYGREVFKDCKKLSGVLLNENLESVAESMFEGCKELKEIELPSLVTNIGEKAFKDSTLENAVIPARTGAIGKNAFENCANLKSVTFEGKALTSLGDNAFANCAALEQITLPEGLTTIGNYAFINTAVKVVYIPASVVKMGIGVFAGCKELTEFDLSPDNFVFKLNADGVLMDANNAMVAYPANKANLDLTGVETITANMFAGTSLTDLTIPSTVKRIDDYAFAYSVNLKTVSFAEGSMLTSIGQYVFADSTSLTTIDLSNATELTDLDSYAFAKIYAVNVLDLSKSKKLTRISPYAFSFTGAKSVILPDSVVTVGELAFSQAANLTSVTFKSSATFGDNIFEDCVALESVVFEKPIETISKQMFLDCVSLKTIALPEGLKTIDDGAFTFSGLTEVALPKSVEIIGAGAFGACENLATFTIPADSMLKSVGEEAFSASGLTSIKLPASLKNIDEGAFLDCPNLRTIEIAEPTESLTIGRYAFALCTSASIYIPKKVTLNGIGVFEEWTAEQTVYVIGRTASDVVNDWYGTFSDIPVETWQSRCNAKIMWNYVKPSTT